MVIMLTYLLLEHSFSIITSADIGPLVQEIRQYLSNWSMQSIRLYRDREYLELDWLIGPVPNEYV